MGLKSLTSNIAKLLAIVLILTIPAQVFAQSATDLIEDDDETPVPGVEVNLLIEYQSDIIVDGKDGDDKIDGSQTYATHELDAAIHFSQFVSLYTTITYEPVRGFLKDFDADLVNDDQFGEDQGVTLEQLYLEFEFNNIAVFFGKFTPNFGRAWEDAPGIYGTDFAEDYEILESIGFGGSFEVENTQIGDLTFTASGFQLDRTGLSKTLFQNTGPNRRSDGGAGNTDGIKSFTVAFDAEEILGDGDENLNLHMAYMRRGKGIGNADYEDEKAFVFALYGETVINERLNIEWIGEIAFIEYFDATEDDVDFYTFGLEFELDERLTWSFSYTNRDVKNPWDGNYDEHLFQTSVGADVFDEWNVNVGYRFTQRDELEDDVHFIGFLLSKEFEYKQSAIAP